MGVITVKNNTIRPALCLQKNSIVVILRSRNWEYTLNEDTSHLTFPAQLNLCPQRHTPPNSGQRLVKFQDPHHWRNLACRKLKEGAAGRISCWMPLCLINIYSKVRGLVWVTLSWCLQQWQRSPHSVGTTGEKQRFHCKRSPGRKGGLCKSPLTSATLHPTGMERVPVPCHPPCISPMASAHSQGQQNTQLLGMHETSGHVHRTESLTCC